MAPHSSTLAWKILWTEEPGRLQSMGSQRVGHDWVTSLFYFSLSCIGEGNGNPLQCSCLENPRDGGAWWAAIYGVPQSRTRLKRLRSSSRSIHSFNEYLLNAYHVTARFQAQNKNWKRHSPSKSPKASRGSRQIGKHYKVDHKRGVAQAPGAGGKERAIRNGQWRSMSRGEGRRSY